MPENYERVRHYREGVTYPAEMQRTIQLKDGSSLENIVPRAVLPGKIDGGEALLLYYYPGGSSEVECVAINDIDGLSAVRTHDQKFGDTWTVEFTYFKPKMDGNDLVQVREDKKRQLIVTHVGYGSYGFHRDIGEGNDIYLEGEDTQYKEDRVRRFPLWRIFGVYNQDCQANIQKYMPKK